MAELHRLMALGTKVIRRWEGPVWDHEPSSLVELRTPQAVIEELAYAMANPVKAGLVRYAKEWPGVTTRPSELGKKRWRIRRPDVFFDPDNPQWPEHAELELARPKLLVDRYSPDQLRDLVARELEGQERDARVEAKRRGWKYLGADRCRKSSPYRRAKSFEPLRRRNPTFAVGRGQRDAFFQAVRGLRAFRNAYRLAREQWRGGIRDTLFPPGTWWMRCFHGVRIAEPPAPA